MLNDPQLRRYAIIAGAILFGLIAFWLYGRLTSAFSQAGSTSTSEQDKVSSKDDSGDDASLFDDATVSSDTSTDSGSSDSAATDQNASTDAGATDNASTEPEQTKIKVTMAKGKTSWVEIKVDGKMVVSESPVGPWEQEFTPEQSFQITVNNPGDVVITENGERVRYDSKSSGVGRITIAVPQKTTQDQTVGADANAAAQQDASAGDVSAQDQATQTQQ